MKPVKFKQHNKVYAEHQDEYQSLPVYEDDQHGGQVIHCWSLTWKERLKLLVTGQLWIYVLNFHKPLQPILPLVDNPWKKNDTKS